MPEPEPVTAVRGRALDARILSVTLDLLRTKGPRAVSIEAVAATAGIAKTTIYRRYEGRDDLLRALEPYICGRTYMAAPVSWGGTHSALRATAARHASTNMSMGTGGIDTKSALCCIRAALRSGRKIWMEESPGVRKALRPS